MTLRLRRIALTLLLLCFAFPVTAQGPFPLGQPDAALELAAAFDQVGNGLFVAGELGLRLTRVVRPFVGLRRWMHGGAACGFATDCSPDRSWTLEAGLEAAAPTGFLRPVARVAMGDTWWSGGVGWLVSAGGGLTLGRETALRVLVRRDWIVQGSGAGLDQLDAVVVSLGLVLPIRRPEPY